MTTQIVVRPSSHHVQIQTFVTATVHTVNLKPGDPDYTFHIYAGKSCTITEVATAPVPSMSEMSVEKATLDEASATGSTNAA